jgi:beta-mannosidase
MADNVLMPAKLSLPLDGQWLVRAGRSDGTLPDTVAGKVIAATVPGCIHTDLLAADLIPDPYIEQNELLLSWVGQTDWIFISEFEAGVDVDAIPVRELVFDGLDTMAEIWLNGHLAGKANNMHHPWRFEVSNMLISGTNHLEVMFFSNERAALAEAERLGDLPRVRRLPYNFIRKMACNYSWDWGPELVTCGIWRSARLECHYGSRIDMVRPLVVAGDESKDLKGEEDTDWEHPVRAQIDVYVDGDGLDGKQVDVVLRDLEGTPVAKASGLATEAVSLAVDRPRLWWPQGHGEQPLYSLEVALQVPLPDGYTGIDHWEGHIGLRKVHLDTSPDEIGSAFAFQINNKSIFILGANWIPDDVFLTRVTKERYRFRLQQAVDAGVNLLRVWGGGIYESDVFYDLCDEMGILVWQDFAFACACYPEEDPFPALVEQEASSNVARLARHPSLALWNGNNENLWLFVEREAENTGKTWQQIVGNRGWGKLFYFDLLPKIVAKLDPSRPYWPGSPWSGSWSLAANDDRQGCNHVWDAWNTDDYTSQRRHKPRFVAEYGHAGPATFATWKHALPDPSQRKPGSKTLAFFNRARNGEKKLKDRTEEHFNLPENFDDWLFVTQLNQARAIRLSVGWHRSLMPRCMGTVIWQLNDCWPVTSWSAIDGYGRPKPLWHELRRAYADRYITIQPEGDAPGSSLWLHFINEMDNEWFATVTIHRVRFDGKEHALVRESKKVSKRGHHAFKLPDEISTPIDPASELVFVKTLAERPVTAYWFFVPDKEARYPAPKWEATVRKVQAGASNSAGDITEETTGIHEVTITAKTLLRDLGIFPDRIVDVAWVDDQLITLLCGEEVTFLVAGVPDERASELTSHPVLRCANEFGLKSWA